MNERSFEEIIFERENFRTTSFFTGDYDECRFISCMLSEVDLSNTNFTDCVFTNCNMSGVLLTKTSFRDCVFIDCKLLGVHFEDCNPFLFSPQFNNCNLRLSSFYNLKMVHSEFRHCDLQEVDFISANLSGLLFENCNFQNARFDNTNVQNADFRSAYNYTIDPENNRIQKAKFSLINIPGLLIKYNILIE